MTVRNVYLPASLSDDEAATLQAAIRNEPETRDKLRALLASRDDVLQGVGTLAEDTERTRATR